MEKNNAAKALNGTAQALDGAVTKIQRKQKEYDDMLAAKEAKIAHLESKLAKIHSVALTSARLDSARPEDRA